MFTGDYREDCMSGALEWSKRLIEICQNMEDDERPR